MDADWRITVDKSDAQLPNVLKRRLQDVVRKFNHRSTKVHRNKGVSLDRENIQAVWKRNIKNGQIRYLINREHPLLATLLENDSEDGKLTSVIHMLESYFPVDMFIKDESAHIYQSQADSEEFESLIHQCMLNYMQVATERPNLKKFLEFISRMEPFASQMNYAESYIKKNLSGLFKE
jgi:hypothetical protein